VTTRVSESIEIKVPDHRARGERRRPVASSELQAGRRGTSRIARRPWLLRAVVAELQRLSERPSVNRSPRPLDRRQGRAESLNQKRTDQ
jgi:hypothetical protein